MLDVAAKPLMLFCEFAQIAEQGAVRIELRGVRVDVADAPGAIFERQKRRDHPRLPGVLALRSPGEAQVHACRRWCGFCLRHFERSRRVPGGEKRAIVRRVDLFAGVCFRGLVRSCDGRGECMAHVFGQPAGLRGRVLRNVMFRVQQVGEEIIDRGVGGWACGRRRSADGEHAKEK